MQPNQQKRIAFYLYFAGLLLLVASLPLSKFTMSIAQFMIAAGWLLDGEIINKFKKFFNPGLPLLLASIYFLHLIGLWNTSDFDYAWKDLRIKLPLLLLPLLLSSGPQISKSQFKVLLFSLIGGVTVSTVISILVYAGVVVRPVNDIRDISIFISHIRLSLLCCLSVFTVFWLVRDRHNEQAGNYYFLLLPVVLWLVYFMILLESLTGLSIIVITGILLANYIVHKQTRLWVQLVVAAVSIAIPVSAFFYIRSINESFTPRLQLEASQPDSLTLSGNRYEHFPEREEYENGYLLWTNICEKELESEWNKRSTYIYNGSDQRNQDIRFTLMRFLTSRGLKKDSAGVWSLTPEEVISIQQGIANVDYQGSGNIRSRIHQVLWELHHYKRTGDPSGHSVAQRLEFWKASVGIIKKNILTGVGIGDVPDAFKDQYKIMETKLRPEWQLRSHNQFLSITIAFGIPGLVWFLVFLIYPLMRQLRKNDILYISFSIISMLSMGTEDTLETQAGVTFFALFNCLFLFVNPYKNTTGGK